MVFGHFFFCIRSIRIDVLIKPIAQNFRIENRMNWGTHPHRSNESTMKSTTIEAVRDLPLNTTNVG